MYKSELAAENVKTRRQTFMRSGIALYPASVAATTNGLALAETVRSPSRLAESKRGELYGMFNPKRKIRTM